MCGQALPTEVQCWATYAPSERGISVLVWRRCSGWSSANDANTMLRRRYHQRGVSSAFARHFLVKTVFILWNDVKTA